MHYPAAKSILLAAAIAIFAGCESLDVPPGMTRPDAGAPSGPISRPLSPEARYSMAVWYKEANGEKSLPESWRKRLDDGQNQALDELHRQWLNNLEILSGHFILPDNSDFIALAPAAIAGRTDRAETEAMLEDLRKRLFSPVEIAVPKDACLDDDYWRHCSPLAKDEFAVWADGRRLVLPPPNNMKPDQLKAQLDDILSAFRTKHAIYDALVDAKATCDDGDFIPALDTLIQFRTCLARPELLKSALEDTTTLPLLDRTIADLPQNCIDWTLASFNAQTKTCADKTRTPFHPVTNSVNALDTTLSAIESKATATLAAWIQDLRFSGAYAASIPKIHETIQKLAALRTAVATRLLEDCFAEKLYWNAFVSYSTLKAELCAGNDPQFGLYSLKTVGCPSSPSIAQAVAADLRKYLLGKLHEATGALLDVADKELRLNARNGYALALCKMTERMAAIVEAANTAAAKDNLDKAQAIAGKAVKAMEDSSLKRQIVVTDMSSHLTGLGHTFTLDVMHNLEKLVKACGLENDLAISQAAASPNVSSYMLYDGVVANFDGQELVERQNTRTLRVYGEIRKSANPQHAANPDAPAFVYSQNLKEILVNMREVERIAHVRLFASLRGPGFTTLAEVNEFYSKRFVIEESHPFNDVRVIDVLKTTDASQLPAPDTPPQLRYDRVWTAGEMLDWARRDALKVFSLKLLFHLNQFPFLLEGTAQQAEAAGDLAAATERRGLCFALTERIDVPRAFGAALEEPPVPEAKCYAECIDNLRRQGAALAQLKQNALASLLKTANSFYMSKHH